MVQSLAQRAGVTVRCSCGENELIDLIVLHGHHHSSVMPRGRPDAAGSRGRVSARTRARGGSVLLGLGSGAGAGAGSCAITGLGGRTVRSAADSDLTCAWG